MSDLQWEGVIGMAAVVSAICAIVAAVICVLLFRRTKSADYLGEQMRDGDVQTRNYAEHSLREIRATVDRIEKNQERREEQVIELNRTMARIEGKQSNEERHIGHQLKVLQDLISKNTVVRSSRS